MRRLALVVLLFLLWAPGAYAWTWPVQGPVLLGFSFDSGQPYAGGQHRGIDIGAPSGTSVAAPASGTVTFAGTVPTSGRSVTIATQDGYSVTLTHLGSIGVAKGASVGEGSAVGTVGPSGTPELDVPYVYMGVRVTANPQGYLNPLSFLPALPPPVAVTTAPPPPLPVPDPVPSPAAPTTVTTTTASEPAPEPTTTPAAAEASPATTTETPAAEASAPPADTTTTEAPASDATVATTAAPPAATDEPASAPAPEATSTPTSGAGDVSTAPPTTVETPAATTTTEAPASEPAPAAAPAPAPPVAQPDPAPAPPPAPAAQPSAQVVNPDPGYDPTASDEPDSGSAAPEPAPAVAGAVVPDPAPAPAADDAFVVHALSPVLSFTPAAAVVALFSPAHPRTVRTTPLPPPAVAARPPSMTTLPAASRRARTHGPGRRGSEPAPVTPAHAAPAIHARHRHALWPLFFLLALVGAAVPKAVRMIRSSSKKSEGAHPVAVAEDPRRAGVAVCERPAPSRPCGGLRRAGRRLRALPPAQGKRRPHGERDGRARHAGDGVRRPRGRVAS